MEFKFVIYNGIPGYPYTHEYRSPENYPTKDQAYDAGLSYAQDNYDWEDWENDQITIEAFDCNEGTDLDNLIWDHSVDHFVDKRLSRKI